MLKGYYLARALLLQVLIVIAPINSIQNLESNLLDLLDQVSESRLVNHTKSLTDFQTRYALSYKCNMSAMFLHQYFDSLKGFEATFHYFTIDSGKEFTGINVIASKNGEWNKKEYVMLIAHYDSISDVPYMLAPGADDNACGVAVLMEVGSLLSEICLARTLIFIVFSGEELGLVGSRAWVKENREILEGVVGVICLDGVARGTGISIMFADYESYSLAELVFNLSTTLGYSNFRILPYELGVSGSDSGAFLDSGLRVIRLWDEDSTYIHTAFDEIETLNRERLVETARTILATVFTMANSDLDEIFTESSLGKTIWYGSSLFWTAIFFGVVCLCIILFILIRKSKINRFPI